MNQKQKSYLTKRVDEIMAQHQRDITAVESYEMPTIGEGLIDGKLKLRASAEVVKVISDYHISSSTYGNTVSVKELVTGMDKWVTEMEKANDNKRAAVGKRIDALKKYATSLKDKIVFGGDEEALSMLAAFADMKF